MIGSFRPPRVRNLADIGGLPNLLAVLVGTLGLLAVGHGLWRAVHARVHDFAILATLGMQRRDLRAVVRWQEAAIAAVAVAIGIPAGLLIASVAWSAVTTATGVLDETVAPSLVIVIVAAVAVALTQLVAALAGQWATRAHPAAGLRTDPGW